MPTQAPDPVPCGGGDIQYFIPIFLFQGRLKRTDFLPSIKNRIKYIQKSYTTTNSQCAIFAIDQNVSKGRHVNLNSIM